MITKWAGADKEGKILSLGNELNLQRNVTLNIGDGMRSIHIIGWTRMFDRAVSIAMMARCSFNVIGAREELCSSSRKAADSEPRREGGLADGSYTTRTSHGSGQGRAGGFDLWRFPPWLDARGAMCEHSAAYRRWVALWYRRYCKPDADR